MSSYISKDVQGLQTWNFFFGGQFRPAWIRILWTYWIRIRNTDSYLHSTITLRRVVLWRLRIPPSWIARNECLLGQAILNCQKATMCVKLLKLPAFEIKVNFDFWILKFLAHFECQKIDLSYLKHTFFYWLPCSRNVTLPDPSQPIRKPPIPRYIVLPSLPYPPHWWEAANTRIDMSLGFLFDQPFRRRYFSLFFSSFPFF